MTNAPFHVLHVDSMWNGQPAPQRAASVALRLDPRALWVHVEAPFHADPPPAQAPGRCPALWEYEVVELFIAGPKTRYLEIELGPHGHYLVLQLSDIRCVITDELHIDFDVDRQSNRWTGAARIPREWLPSGPHRYNAFAIHGQGKARQYLAAHPTGGDRPDFHRLEACQPHP